MFKSSKSGSSSGGNLNGLNFDDSIKIDLTPTDLMDGNGQKKSSGSTSVFKRQGLMASPKLSLDLSINSGVAGGIEEVEKNH